MGFTSPARYGFFVATKKRRQNRRFWSWKRDLNTRPAHYECAALPTELFQQMLLKQISIFKIRNLLYNISLNFSIPNFNYLKQLRTAKAIRSCFNFFAVSGMKTILFSHRVILILIRPYSLYALSSVWAFLHQYHFQ